MDTKILEDIGLTKGEITVYLALLEEGSVSAGKVLEKAGVQNSVFHFCVNRLIDKGLVAYVVEGKRKIYSAADPENFLVYVKDKEEQVKKLLPKLKAKQNFLKQKEGVELFKGLKGVINLLNILIKDSKKGDEFLFFAPDVSERNEDVQKFYARYDMKRKDKGLVTKGIAISKLKSLFETRKYLEMKYSDKPLPANSAICGNKMVLVSWGDQPTGVLIESKQIIDQQKEFFKSLWGEL